METKKRNVGPLYGLIAAGCMIAFTTGIYLGGINATLSEGAFLGYFIPIILAVLGAQAQKKVNGDRLEFHEALRVSFTVLVFGFAAQTFYYWALLNFVNPHFKQVLTQENIKRTIEFMKSHKDSDEKMRNFLDYQKNVDDYSLRNMTLRLAFYIIPQFVVAMIIAAIVKKKKT